MSTVKVNNKKVENTDDDVANSSFKLTRYSRTKILKLLGSRDVSLESEDIPKLMREANISSTEKDKFIEFMNEECQKGQNNSELDMTDLEPFSSLNQWTKLVRDGAAEHGGQELALMMKVIASMETHPDIKSSGVDFK